MIGVGVAQRCCLSDAQRMKEVYRIFIFVGTVSGGDEGVLEHLLKFDQITDVHFISGQYVLLAVAEISLLGEPMFSSVQDLAQDLVQKTRRIHGVRDADTLVPFLS